MICSDAECVDGSASSYRGVWNITSSGLTCQKWSEQTPQTHSYTPANYAHKGMHGIRTCTTHIPRIYHACTTHVPRIYHAYTTHVPRMHVPRIYHAYTTHVPRMCTEQHQQKVFCDRTCASSNSKLINSRDW